MSRTKSRELFREPLTEAEVRALLGERSPRDVVSLRSTKARELNFREQLPDDDTLIKLLAAEPGLWRRPVITIGNELSVGYSAKRIQELIAQASSRSWAVWTYPTPRPPGAPTGVRGDHRGAHHSPPATEQSPQSPPVRRSGLHLADRLATERYGQTLHQRLQPIQAHDHPVAARSGCWGLPCVSAPRRSR